MAKKPHFELGADASVLIALLRDSNPGDIISWDRLSQEVGKPIREAYGSLNTARKRLRKDEGMVFEAVRGVGIKRLENHEIPKVVPNAMNRIRRLSSRTLEKQSCCVVEDLDDDQKVQFLGQVSVLGALMYASKQKTVAKIESKIDPVSPKQLPLAETLRAIQRQNNETRQDRNRRDRAGQNTT